MIEIDTLTRPAAPETVTPLKPSEAIRLGRMLHPRCEGQLVTETGDGLAVCAFGAMAVGYGWTASEDGADCSTGSSLALSRLHRASWPAAGTIDCPAGADYGGPPDDHLRGPYCRQQFTIATAIVHLNDDHHCSTERIADWLEGLGL